ncbi:MAG: hypothetical protein ACFE0R_05125 [Salinarimonas sp.]
MFGSGRPSIIVTTLKIVIVVGALSWVAADWVSLGFDREALARLASDRPEPLITGSLRLDSARLDPCGDEPAR